MESKSNFHSNEWIISQVKERYETAVAYFGSEDFVIGAFLIGSQNYKLDIESSDIDVKVYTLPSLESIIENGKPESCHRRRWGARNADRSHLRLSWV